MLCFADTAELITSPESDGGRIFKQMSCCTSHAKLRSTILDSLAPLVTFVQ